MNKQKQRALEAAGWQFGDAADFLGLSEEERQEVELRANLCQAIHRRRKELKLNDKQLAAKLNCSKSQVAKLEIGVELSLDFMFRALFALGGRLAELAEPKPRRRPKKLAVSK